MKELAVLLGIVAILIAFSIHQNYEFSKHCRASGGVPSIGRYDNTCYAPGVAIDVD